MNYLFVQSIQVYQCIFKDEKMNKDMDYFFQFIFIAMLIGLARGACNKRTGPSCSTECVLLKPYYNKYQWATCLTDTYIKTFSKGRHYCRDTSVTYCWYQCMIEVHDLDEGPVHDDCACGTDAPKNVTSQQTVVSIPDWCCSPSGADCSWYKECLEKRYPCKQQGNSYALDYAEKFCNLYHDHYQKFDTIGQEWIDAVRKCLQVKLVPILRPFVMATCESIKETAFDSHPSCYLYPDFGKPSICDIGAGNWARIFWTVKGALIQDATTTLKQMLDVVLACGADILSTGMEKIQLIFRQEREMVVTGLNKFAENIADQVSSKTGWYNRGVIVFGFPTLKSSNRNKRSADNNTDLVYVNLLIAAQSEFDLNAPNMLATNVSAEAISVAKAIENGEIRLDIEEGTKFTGLSICIDYNCTETSLQVTPAQKAQQEKQDKGGVNRTTIIVVVCAVTFGMILVVSGIVILKKVRHS